MTKHFLLISFFLSLVSYSSAQGFVPAEKDLGAYLLVTHSDSDHSLHFAVSYDGYTFTSVNGEHCVIDGDTIAEQRGIRDPHIFRGPDGGFCMAMTDLHVFGKRDGKRDTEWQRDAKKYGWGNNRALVLMKSFDLIHWTHNILRLDTLGGEYSELACAWAPETTYDERSGHLMLYFTMRFGQDKQKMYWAYTDEDFTRLTTRPQLLFAHPNNKSAIDGDLVKVGDKWALHYVPHEGGRAGIKVAWGDQLTGPFNYETPWIDTHETHSCEAPNVWKRIREDKWVLMYDRYGEGAGSFGFMETTDFKSWTPLGKFNGGVMKATNFTGPKHGAVVRLTEGEADRLVEHWGLDSQQLKLASKAYSPNVANPILPGRYADPAALYSHNTGKYYIYPTSDGFDHWGGYYFKCFSSTDLASWTEEGIILDLKRDVTWSDRNAWAPTILEKKGKDGKYKYYFYYTASQRIGVAVSDSPTGPFHDSGRPLIETIPEGAGGGQNIDPDVFEDPKSGKVYLYWGNGFLAMCELGNDLVSVKKGSTKVLIPCGHREYSEASHVFCRQGKYYFMWSENDTRSEDYRVRYIVSDTPTPKSLDPSQSTVILSKDPARNIYATGHNGTLCKEGSDEWYIVYHRFMRPGGVHMGGAAGYNREVCLDRITFDANGVILPITPSE